MDHEKLEAKDFLVLTLTLYLEWSQDIEEREGVQNNATTMMMTPSKNERTAEEKSWSPLQAGSPHRLEGDCTEYE
jgi:hypothetical protein